MAELGHRGVDDGLAPLRIGQHRSAPAEPCGPAASTSLAVSASFSTRRAASTTSAPASANPSRTTPRPDEAPVTITTLSVRRTCPELSLCRLTFRGVVDQNQSGEASRVVPGPAATRSNIGPVLGSSYLKKYCVAARLPS